MTSVAPLVQPYPARPRMAELLPERKHGRAEIRHFEVTQAQADFSRLRSFVTRGREGATKAGRFAQLFVDRFLVMSDTDMEWHSNLEWMRCAHGNILIAGLGLGFTLLPVLAKESIKTVTVVEKSADVLGLVGPLVEHPKLTLVQGDIHDWPIPRGSRWDLIYFDIWPEWGNHHREAKELKRRFQRRGPRMYWMEED